MASMLDCRPCGHDQVVGSISHQIKFFLKIKLTLAYKPTQPKNGYQDKFPGKAKVAGPILATSLYECRLGDTNMGASMIPIRQ